MIPQRFRNRRVALPYDHGAYALFLGPLVIGLVAGGRWHIACVYLVVASSAAFLMRQPLTVLVMISGGRRTPADRPAAWFWLLAYGAVAASHVTGLVVRGHGYVLHLAVPGALVAGWHLALVRRRAERRQMLLEVLAVGVLALAAPAGLWIGAESYDPMGWLLWVLVWAGSATAVVHAYLRLSQRRPAEAASVTARLWAGRQGLAAATLHLLVVLALGLAGVVSPWLAIAFGIQLADVLHGSLVPARGRSPKSIGMRLLFGLVLFTLAFVLAWGR
ncbi:MAG: YwiC-like family protein [Planctomycetota bacterium]|nr:YwiC-like family protein [Planctomycetota bacterium]